MVIDATSDVSAIPFVGFQPIAHPALTVQILSLADVERQARAVDLNTRHRAHFHQLIVCRAGQGFHFVDFEPIKMQAGDVLNIHPGQVQQFQFDPDFSAYVVGYRPHLHRTFIPELTWFPGSDVPTLWNLPLSECHVARDSVQELLAEQDRFDGSAANIALMESLLSAFLARLHLRASTPRPATQLPPLYISYRQYIEDHLFSRPTATTSAAALGYSVRSLDRACVQATGQTAKQVLDERVALEIRRRLAYTDTHIADIGRAFGFADTSSFSKFTRRHLGVSPTDVRSSLNVSTTADHPTDS